MMRLSPDGARILTASADKTAKLWDGSSGELIASLLIRVRSTTWRLVRRCSDPDGERRSQRQALGCVLWQVDRLLCPSG
jgi:WD40 repeat protein